MQFYTPLTFCWTFSLRMGEHPLDHPFSSEHFVSPWTLLGGVKHGVPGEPLSEVLKQVFSRHDAGAIGLEVLVLLLVMLLSWRFVSSARGGSGGD